MGLISRVSSRTYRLIMEEQDYYTASPTSNSKKSSSNYSDKNVSKSSESWGIPECLRIMFDKAPSDTEWTKLLFALKNRNTEVSISNLIRLLETSGDGKSHKKYEKLKRTYYKKEKG